MSLDNFMQMAMEALPHVLWHETMFEDLQWYYAEGCVYILRCKHGTENEHYLIIKASNPDEAISKAVFDLYKAGGKE